MQKKHWELWFLASRKVLPGGTFSELGVPLVNMDVKFLRTFLQIKMAASKCYIRYNLIEVFFCLFDFYVQLCNAMYSTTGCNTVFTL